VLAAGAALWEKWKIPIRIQTGSPAAAFIALFQERGVEVVAMTPAEHAAALGQLIDAAENDGLRHLGASALNAAVRGALVRSSGDADVWARRTSKVDITPLVAVTLALGGVPAAAPERKPRIHTLKEANR
jgi:hypothetical protein